MGLIWSQGGPFYLDYQAYQCDCWFKIVNHMTKVTTVLYVQRKKWFKIGKAGLRLLLIETEVETHTCKLL